MKVKNYYKILNINEDASPKQIKDAYRKLVKFWHPDVNSISNSHEKIIEINEAYEILRDIHKREVYNRIYRKYFYTELVSYHENNHSQRYAEYQNGSKTSIDFDILQDWIKDARKKADNLLKKGLKKVDSSLETGFFIFGEIGNFFSILVAIVLLGVFGYNSLMYIIKLVSGTVDFSIFRLVFSLIGIALSMYVIINWVNENLKNE